MPKTKPNQLILAYRTLLRLICLVSTLGSTALYAEAQANGTTVFRCIDLNGVVSFADAPCKDSTSHRLRIEHSLIQSAPISMAEQQRLRALEERLNSTSRRRQGDRLKAAKMRTAEQNAGAERCKQATAGLRQIRLRKRRGYPVQQARRIDNEEAALQGEISSYCR